MNKLEYVARQLDKTKKKRFEQLVVHRIWNTLNDARIKFVTQQFVRRPSGRAMTDMYFPQLGIHIEVDEGHHKAQVEEDALRQADIVDAIGHEVFRVDVTKTLEEIHGECDTIVACVKDRIARRNDFVPWDLEAEMNPNTYIEKGFIDIADDAAFRTMAEAASCFGRLYKGLQRAYIRHPVEPNKRLWFPKSYENEEWKNHLSNDEETVREFCKIEGRKDTYLEEALNEHTDVRLLFARVRGPLGDLLYRYKGEYELDRDRTSDENGAVYKRVATRSSTYPHRSEAASAEAESQELDGQEIYESLVRGLSPDDRLRLAALILSDLTALPVEDKTNR